MNTEFLAYVRNACDLNPQCRFFVGDGVTMPRETSVLELSTHRGPIVSFDLANMVDDFRRVSRQPPSGLVDVCDAVRLVAGRPASESQISIWQLLARNTIETDAIKTLHRMAIGEVDVAVDIVLVMNGVIRSLSQLWYRTEVELRSRGEHERFFSVEAPIALLTLECQLKGICFSRDVLDTLLGDLTSSVARSAANLRKNWNVLRASDSAQLARAIAKDGNLDITAVIKNPLAGIVRSRLTNVLDLLPEQHALAAEIKAFNGATHDKAVLLQLAATEGDRVFPRYAPIGTVTSRIIVRAPSLQYLSKRARAVLHPDEGRLFLYADYAQFEPGILADETRDAQLTADYNSGDVYSQLSLQVFGTQAFRDHAKVVFLAFCYGMSAARASILLTSNVGDVEEVQSLVSAFFERYRSLERWRSDLYAEFERESRIGTRLGNYRYKVRKAPRATDAERRCALSQRIQGTASLILKRALLAIRATGVADLLLPMHDAALFEVDIAQEYIAKNIIAAEFERAFVSECVTIVPKITFKEFALREVNDA